MKSKTSRARRFALILTLAWMTTLAGAQGDREGQGLGREGMWPAPTAEDWKKPVLITFQRTWKDALEVSKATGRAILICINMDGEIASEHYAGIRYRQKEVAKLYEPYVCVIASTYRHNPRDYDDDGNRILCPRFGSVTCGEHIWIEPIIYEKFCEGQRVAPRHICIDLEGNEVYDVFYKNDTASVFDAIRDQVPESTRKAPVIRGDRPLLERVASRDVRDRTAVEEAYKKGDKQLRSQLLDAAMKNKEAEQLGLLRLAIFGLDSDLGKQARAALTEVQTPDAADLIAEAMQTQLDEGERKKLIAALKRMGGDSARARWLAGVHEGLSGASKGGTVKLKGWSKERAGASYPAPRLAFGGYGRSGFVEDKTREAEAATTDPIARIELAEGSLAAAMKAPKTYEGNPRMARRVTRQLYEDVESHAKAALELGAPKWRVHTVLALSAYYGGDRQKAYPLAEKAVRELPPNEPGWNAMAVVTIFAESRWKAIQAAVRQNEKWPSSWMADLHTAYEILLRHPLGTDSQVAWHYDLLDWLGAHRRAQRALIDGIERFPASAKLHEKLRTRILKFRGPARLEASYEQLLKQAKARGAIEPYAGIASISAAQTFRRVRNYDNALAAYQRAIDHFEKGIAANPANKAYGDHAIAMAHAARARIYLQLEKDDEALASMLASFARRPGSAGSRDEIGITPGETAQMLLARFHKTGKQEHEQKLADALAKIDPRLLAPDIGLGPPTDQPK
ncbi:MAG: hypothetical protein AAGD14_12865 [Planctomycetota bacterium]